MHSDHNYDAAALGLAGRRTGDTAGSAAVSRPNVEAPGLVGTGRAQGEQQSKPIVAPGVLPPKRATACAEVLCQLLSGVAMRGMDGVFDASTTRLAAHIGYLRSKHGWSFEKRDVVNVCNDGRTVTIVEYSLSPEVIDAAMACGAAEWCKAVRAARRALRAKAGQAKLQAERANTVAALRRRASYAPGQADLFGAAP